MNSNNVIVVQSGKVSSQNLGTEFANINISLVSDGLEIHVPENTVVNTPLIFIHDGDKTASFTVHIKIDAYGVLNVSQIVIGDGSLDLDCLVALVGSGASSEVKTVAVASGEQKTNIQTKIENLAPHTVANIVNHGVVKDDARLAFDGVGKIHKGMNGSDAQQETRLLNLSLNAKAIANPFLLIDEGDITAGHAASIGRIDEEQIYYLMSRGMKKPDAEKLIVSGFLVPFIDGIDDEEVKEALALKIEAKLD